MSVNAEDNNDRLFPLFRRQLTEGLLSFTSTVEKLVVWLGSSRAYYPRARPQIVGLLETAYSAVLLARSDHDMPLSVIRQTQPTNAWVIAYLKLLGAILSHTRCFPERELQARLNALTQATGLDANTLIAQVRQPPAVPVSAPPGGRRPAHPTASPAVGRAPQTSASPVASSSMSQAPFASISAKSPVSVTPHRAVGLRVVTDLQSAIDKKHHTHPAATPPIPPNEGNMPGPSQGIMRSKPEPPEIAGTPVPSADVSITPNPPGQSKVDRRSSGTPNLAQSAGSLPASRSFAPPPVFASLPREHLHSVAIASRGGASPAPPPAYGTSSASPAPPLSTGKGKEKSGSAEVGPATQVLAKPKLKARVKPRKMAIDDEDFILADLEWFKERADGKQGEVPEASAKASSGEKTTAAQVVESADTLETAGSTNAASTKSADAISAAAVESWATPADSATTTATAIQSKNTLDTAEPDKKGAAETTVSSPLQASPASSTSRSPRRAFRMGTKGKRGRPPGLRVLPLDPDAPPVPSSVKQDDGAAEESVVGRTATPEVKAESAPESVVEVVSESTIVASESTSHDVEMQETEAAAQVPAGPLESAAAISSHTEEPEEIVKDENADAPVSASPALHKSPSLAPAPNIATDSAELQHNKVAMLKMNRPESGVSALTELSSTTVEPVHGAPAPDIVMENVEGGAEEPQAAAADDSAVKASRKRSPSPMELSIGPPKQKQRTDAPASQPTESTIGLLPSVFPQPLSTSAPVLSRLSSFSTMDLETPTPSPDKQKSDPLTTSRPPLAQTPPVSRTSSLSNMDLESRDPSPQKLKPVAALMSEAAPVASPAPDQLPDSAADSANEVSAAQVEAASVAKPDIVQEKPAMETPRPTYMDMEIDSIGLLVTSHGSPAPQIEIQPLRTVVMEAPQPEKTPSTDAPGSAPARLSNESANLAQAAVKSDELRDVTETVSTEHGEVIGATAGSAADEHEEGSINDTVASSPLVGTDGIALVNNLDRGDLEDGEVPDADEMEFDETVSAVGPALADASTGAPTVNGGSDVAAAATPAADAPLFDPSFVLKSCDRGMPDISTREVSFELSQEDVVSLRRWGKRDIIDEDLSASKCLSLVCYSFPDLMSQLRENKDVADISLFIGKSSPVGWPQDQRLWIEVNGRPSFYISPPFIRGPDELVDLSDNAIPGLNRIRFVQKRDYSDCVFAVILHRPTAHQLDSVYAKRQSEASWKDVLHKLSQFKRINTKISQSVS
ncbi:hypothetical protein OBBRIDRAFT_829682 [Obba rivulosa]|uniref:Uncharacterized protein n=1 Tax=Obba rivulosa TaxID=1052685 RepID=A0A8E2DIS7_9APHY|nr:hypothetical protein OBBRIDRAFT_829682 [Obba rivulosa]